MGLFRRKEIRSAESSVEENKKIIIAEELLAAMRNNDTITVADALQVPCFASCISLLSSTVAMLPVKLYREGQGETVEVGDDKRVKLLNDETGDLLDSFQMKSAFIADYLIHGNGYIYIDRHRNNIEGLYYVKAGDVSYSIFPDPIFKSAVYMINGKQYEHFRLLSLLRKSKNGVYGTGIFEEGKEALATAYNTKVFQHYSVLNGGNKSGFLQSKSKLTEPAMDVLKEKWKLFRQNKNKDPLVLNEGLEFKETSSTSVEMQLNENIQTNNEEICLLFGLAPDIISGKATAEQFANAVRTAVQPILESFQCALNRNLLLESEKGKMYFAFDTTELLKGDMLKRYQAYQIALQSNFMQIDEVRYKEDLPKLGFNYVKLGLQDVLLDVKSGTVYTPNTNQTAKIGNEVLKNGVDSGIIEETKDEQRYNPYHDPTNGRFTTADGGGMGAYLYVEKGQKGKGAYVADKERYFEDKPSIVRQRLASANVEYQEVQKLSSELSEDEIISRVGGGKNSNIDEITKLANGETIKNFNDFKGAAELVQKVETGKEYYFAAGKHAAIIRKSEIGLEYLELQSVTENGFKPLNNSVLKKRFGCQKSHSVAGYKLEAPNFMFDIDALKNNSEIKKLLGYINTSEAVQQKGKLGGTR